MLQHKHLFNAFSASFDKLREAFIPFLHLTLIQKMVKQDIMVLQMMTYFIELIPSFISWQFSYTALGLHNFCHYLTEAQMNAYFGRIQGYDMPKHICSPHRTCIDDAVLKANRIVQKDVLTPNVQKEMES